MIMEAKESHNLPSASWRTRKAGGVIQFKSKGQENWGTDGVRPGLSLKARESEGKMFEDRRQLCQKRQRAQIHLPSIFFVLFKLSVDWMTTLARVVIFTQATDTTANLFCSHPERIVCQLSGHPVAPLG